MFYVSRDKGRNIFLPHPEVEFKNTINGPVAVAVARKRIRFTPIAGDGYVTSALPPRGGREKAEGSFNSSRPKDRPNLTEKEADEFLMNHKDYGVEFVAIGSDGRAVVPLEWDDPGHRSEPYLTDSGKGKYCELCEKQVNIQGLHKHVASKAHLALLVQVEQKIQKGAV